jgi:hypothetical protein
MMAPGGKEPEIYPIPKNIPPKKTTSNPNIALVLKVVKLRPGSLRLRDLLPVI